MVAGILASSRDIMREQGVGALNLNEVARRLGIKPPSLYEYFASKAAVYDELFRVGFEQYRELVIDAVGDLPFWEALHAVLEATIHFAADNREIYELMFQRPFPGFAPSDESMAASVEVTRLGLAFFQQGIDSGEIRTELDTSQVSNLLFAVIGGLTSAYIANEPGTPPERSRFASLTRHAVEVFRVAWSNTGP